MSANQIIQRDGQILTINISNLELVENEKDIPAFIKKGYHILRMEGSGGNPVVWRTKKPDSFVRDMRGVVWSKDLCINPYEADQMVWSLNVELWFDGAIESEEYLDMIARTYGITIDDVVTLAGEARRRMASIVQRRANRAGFRRPDIHRWFCVGDKSFVARNLNR